MAVVGRRCFRPFFRRLVNLSQTCLFLCGNRCCDGRSIRGAGKLIGCLDNLYGIGYLTEAYGIVDNVNRHCGLQEVTSDGHDIRIDLHRVGCNDGSPHQVMVPVICHGTDG